MIEKFCLEMMGGGECHTDHHFSGKENEYRHRQLCCGGAAAVFGGDRAAEKGNAGHARPGAASALEVQ